MGSTNDYSLHEHSDIPSNESISIKPSEATYHNLSLIELGDALAMRSEALNSLSNIPPSSALYTDEGSLSEMFGPSIGFPDILHPPPENAAEVEESRMTEWLFPNLYDTRNIQERSPINIFSHDPDVEVTPIKVDFAGGSKWPRNEEFDWRIPLTKLQPSATYDIRGALSSNQDISVGGTLDLNGRYHISEQTAIPLSWQSNDISPVSPKVFETTTSPVESSLSIRKTRRSRRSNIQPRIPANNKVGRKGTMRCGQCRAWRQKAFSRWLTYANISVHMNPSTNHVNSARNADLNVAGKTKCGVRRHRTPCNITKNPLRKTRYVQFFECHSRRMSKLQLKSI
jgi:hypothetical protein